MASDARLADLCEAIVDCPHSTPVWTDSGVVVLRNQNIRNGRLDLSEPSYTDEAHFIDRTRRAVPTPGDLVITREAPMGKVCMIPLGLRCCLGQRMVLVRPDRKSAEPRYLLYALQSKAVQYEIGVNEGTGSTVSNLRIPLLESLPIPTRPLPEQRAIAHILGTLDDKIELNRRMSETLEATARALFKSWFVDFDPVRAKSEGRDPGLPKHLADLFPDSFEDCALGELPRGWQEGVLDQLVDVTLGGDWGSDERDDEKSEAAYCIRGADIPELQIGGIGKMPIRFLKPSSLAKRRLNDGDLVVEISGGSPTQSTGRPVLVSHELLGRLRTPLVCSNFCRLLKLKVPEASKFIYLWLRSLYTNDEFLQFENGTTGIKNFAFTLFSSTFKFCIPSTPVLQFFDRSVSELFKRQQASAAESDTLCAVRDTLLPKLISGELRVKDAERIVERTAA
jgi:type I restriction enzyme S subunit